MSESESEFFELFYKHFSFYLIIFLSVQNQTSAHIIIFRDSAVHRTHSVRLSDLLVLDMTSCSLATPY